ncbi:tyrosine-protein kinase Src42A [Hemitrygon akajei]|uniref:tyrosine-protein kinase Src42A n=1 Tax=Hemitrygon akajei TaxID=2704970 RepID=UPI003BF960D7
MGRALSKQYCAVCPCRCCRSNSNDSNERTSNRAGNLVYTNQYAVQSRYVALYNYKPRTSEDLPVKEGEEVEILSQEGEWTLVKKTEGRDVEEGYVPSSFVAEVGSLAAARWFFGRMTHVDVKRCLLRDENQNGSFLVWQNNEMDDLHFLSVRYGDIVKHYKINEEADFQNLSRVINQCSEEADYLCTRLTKPCVKLDRPSTCTLAHIAEWEIQHTSLQKKRLIGSGHFGEVWEGTWNGTTEVAIKELKGVDLQSKKKFLEEVEIMKQLQHERLIKLLAVCTEREPFCIVTELMTKGNLHKYLKSHSETRNLEFSLLNGFAIQIAEGMVYLEEKCCIHRDLRSENILLTEMLCCKISDFGLARLLKDDHDWMAPDCKVPIKWMAPEIFLEFSYTVKSDVWSFGVLLTEIVSYGEAPFPDKSILEFVNDLLNGIDVSPPACCPDSLNDIVLQCWNRNSDERPTFKDLQAMLMKCSPMLKTEELLLSTLECNSKKLGKWHSI